MEIKPIFDIFRDLFSDIIDLLKTDIFQYSGVYFSFLHALVGGFLLCAIIRIFWKGV